MCAYINVWVWDTCMYKSYSTQNLSLQRTQRKGKAFHACMYILIYFFVLPAAQNCPPGGQKKKKNLCLLPFVKWKIPWFSGKDEPPEDWAGKALPTSVCTLGETAAFFWMQNSCVLIWETLILIYLLFRSQCSCHLSLSLFAYMAEQLGRPFPASPLPLQQQPYYNNLMGEGGKQASSGKEARWRTGYSLNPTWPQEWDEQHWTDVPI